MKTKYLFARNLVLLALVSAFSLQPSALFSQGTAFTYQGQLTTGGNLANGNYDLRFSLWTAVSGGSSVAGYVTNAPVTISNGLFTVTLDFGSDVFTGDPLWLQIGVRTNGATGGYTGLSPRQQLTPAPYAIMAGSAGNLLGNLPVAQVSGTVPLAQIPAAVVTNNETGVSISGTFTGNGAGVANVNAAQLNGMTATNFWQLDGNNVTAGSFLGSTNFQPVEIRVNNTRALRLEPTYSSTALSNIVNVIGGSLNNFIAPGFYGSVIAGGAGYYLGQQYSNTISAHMSFLGGGYDNSIQTYADNSVLGGGEANSIQTYADYSFLGGGYSNSIQTYAVESFLGGGEGNAIQTNAFNSFLGGGYGNSIQPDAFGSFLGGGYYNFIQTNAYRAFLGGGYQNTNTGSCSAIPGGIWNVAADYSFAAGAYAKATNAYAFVWSDGSVTTSSTNDNSVTMRASGGYRFFTSTIAIGANLAAGSGSWTSMSDRNAKENFTPVDGLAVLEKVTALPVSTWNYKSQDAAIRHIGPMAQDFKAAFAVGESDTGITAVDADGVALAAIQGLNRKLEQKETEITELKARLEKLEQSINQRNGGEL